MKSPESSLKVCAELDEICLALPMDYLDPPDGGNVSMAEQVRRMYADVQQLREEVARLEASTNEIREAQLRQAKRITRAEAVIEQCANAIEYLHKAYLLSGGIGGKTLAAIAEWKETK